MSRVPRPRLLRILFGLGALGNVVGAVVLYFFFTGVASADAVRSAPICPNATRSPSSQCLSLFGGRITWEGPVSKGNRRVIIALEDTTADVAYRCNESPPDACSGIAIQAGSAVVTGWWRGRLVTFGAPGSRPRIVTDLNPEDQLLGLTVALLLVIPGVSSIVAGALLWQAPSTVEEFVNAIVERQPDPPRTIELGRLWRVTLGYSTFGGYFLWVLLYVVAAITLLNFAALRLAPLLLAATFVGAMAPAALLAPVALYYTLETSDRRSIVVKRFETETFRGGTSTAVWYDGLGGREQSSNLGRAWTGRVHVGDRLDALTDPKTGEIERVLSTPPA